MRISIVIVSGIFIALVDIKEIEAFFFGNSRSSLGQGLSQNSNSFLGTLMSGFGQGQQNDNSYLPPLSGGYNYEPPSKLSNALTTGFGQGLSTLASGFNQGHQGLSGGHQSQNSISSAFS